MDPIQQRYHFEKQVLSTVNGTLHEGKDLSLQRHVFLYQIQANRQTTRDETKRLIGSVSHFGSPNFLHMIDMEESREGVYVVLEYRTGSSVLPLLNSRSLSLTFPLVLHLIISFGEALQDALEERVRGFSVTAENIWLDQDQLMVINYWAEGETHQRGVLGLTHLLYQILFQTPHIPTDHESIEKDLSLSMEPYFPEKVEDFSKLIRRVLKGHESLSSFLQGLQSLEKKNKIPIPEKETEPVKDHPMERIPEKGKKPLPFSRRTAISSGLLLLFILGFAFYRQIGTDPSTPASSPVDTTHPVMEKETVDTPPPIEIKASPLPSSDQTVQVPDLHGLSREEAEKLALSYGLHYKYIVAYDDQQQGLVFKQEPESGTEVPKGGYLTFWISKGSATQ